MEVLVKSPAEIFLAKVHKTESCWLWTGASWNGYGRFDNERAHRFAYRLFKGPIPEGMEIDHSCHIAGQCMKTVDCPHRRCVNPDHLKAVTHRVNVLRGNGVAAKRKMQTHCVRGHEFTKENIYEYRGCRLCRACHKIYTREYMQRKRAQKQERSK